MLSQFKRLCLVSSISALVACGGSGGSNTPAPNAGGANAVALGGSAVKGPLANARVEVFALDTTKADLKGDPVTTGTTNAQAQFTGINLNAENAPYLLVVTAVDGQTTDISTGRMPIIPKLSTVITKEMLSGDADTADIYATPLTSMAVEVVANQAQVNQGQVTNETLNARLKNAQNQVKTTLGFGLEQDVDIFTSAPLLTEDTDTTDEQEDVAKYRLAIEALSAVVAKIAEDTSEIDSATDALLALAKDLGDGELDGQAGGVSIAELGSYDVTELDDIDLDTLNVPGTETSVNDIETVLREDLEDTGVEQTLDESIDVEAESPELVADADLDGRPDNADNCQFTPNANQLDSNRNGVGDVCDSAPVIAGALMKTVREDTSLIVDLAEGASDPEGDTLSFYVNGTELSGSTYAFSPESNENGERVITYFVNDGTPRGEGDQGTQGRLTVTITPVNDAGNATISGEAKQNQTLTASVNDVDGTSNANISYQWFSGEQAITGETAATLTLTQAQVGQAISVRARYQDDDGHDNDVRSQPSAPVVDVNDPTTGQLALIGTPRQGEQVSVDTSGLSDPDGAIIINRYQWKADGENIADASDKDFTITPDLVGKTLSVAVTFSDSGFTSYFRALSVSFAQPVANANDVATGSVTISNTSPSEGDTLTANLNNIQDQDGLTNVSYAYQWLADNQAIQGATSASFVTTQAQVGKQLSVRVSFTDDLGSAELISSSSTSIVTNVNDDPQGQVSIVGNPVVGQTLTASNSLSDEDGLGEIRYEWFVNGASKQQSGASYTVQQADAGFDITVKASYEDAFGEQESVESNPVTAQEAPSNAGASLVGAWNFGNDGSGKYDNTVLTLTATEEFFFFDVNTSDNDDCRQKGYEYGTYELDGNTLTLSAALDTNGCVGLFDNERATTISISAQTSTGATFSGGGSDDPFTINATRMLTNADSLVGAWHEPIQDSVEGGSNGKSHLMVFMGDGAFYSMDAEIANLSANVFSYGDYTFTGEGLSVVFKFDAANSESDETFGRASVNGDTLSFDTNNPNDILRRVDENPSMPNPALAFTQAGLTQGFKVYSAVWVDGCNANGSIEPLSFNASGYTLKACDGSTNEVDKPYTVLDSGVVHLVEANDYIQILSFDPDLQAFNFCWRKTASTSEACADDSQAKAFLSQAAAQAYIDSKAPTLPAGTIEVTWIEERTAYSQGASHTANNGASGVATMQCDLNQNKQVGERETFKLRLTRNGDSVNVNNYTDPSDPENYTMGFNASLGQFDLAGTEVEQDPTGQTGDIYTSSNVDTGSATWNAQSSMFEGTLRSVTTLTWSLNDQSSVCDETVSIEATVTGGDVQAFLSQR